MVLCERVLRVPGGARIVVTKGDIIRCGASAIVNPADKQMQGGGGLDEAIRQAAGRELTAACRELQILAPPATRLRVGRAKPLPSGNLRRYGSKHVIATVGPKYRKYSPVDADALLLQAHDSCLNIAADFRDCPTIAFPAVSCGVYGFPKEHAARKVLRHVVGRAVWLKNCGIREVRFVLYHESTFTAWAKAAECEARRS